VSVIELLAASRAKRALEAGTKGARLDRIQRNAARAALSNPHAPGNYSGSGTFINRGTTAPAEAPNIYSFSAANLGPFEVVGGRLNPGLNTIVSATTDAGGSATYSYGRVSVMANSRYFAWAVANGSLPYRPLVNDRYVDRVGLIASGGTSYLFFDGGTRDIRKFTIETQLSGMVVANARVEAQGTLFPVDDADSVYGAYLLDSYAQGAILPRGDALPVVVGDLLGIKMLSSGLGGTGWFHPNQAVVGFKERIGFGDLGLGYKRPDVIFLGGTVNDSASDPATIQANALTGLRLARAQFPDVPIIMFGVHAAPGKILTGSPSLTAAENAVRDAVIAFNDPLTRFVPMIGDTTTPWYTGNGSELVFTGSLASAATSGTLAFAWTGGTGPWNVIFSNGDLRTVTLTNGATTATWTGGLSGTATATAGAYLSQNGTTVWAYQYDRIHLTFDGVMQAAQRQAAATLAALQDMLGAG
jgi:hypothetical protein